MSWISPSWTETFQTKTSRSSVCPRALPCPGCASSVLAASEQSQKVELVNQDQPPVQGKNVSMVRGLGGRRTFADLYGAPHGSSVFPPILLGEASGGGGASQHPNHRKQSGVVFMPHSGPLQGRRQQVRSCVVRSPTILLGKRKRL